MRKILLIEPNYNNKFPPIGLMKFATYFKSKGDEVVFYKGDLKDFIIDRITDKCIESLYLIDDSIDWFLKKSITREYIKTRKRVYINKLELGKSEFEILLLGKLNDFKNYYWKEEWKHYPEWDKVLVTTLFTFYWDITVKTINFAKYLVKDPKDLMVGGVLASIQPDELEAATGIKPFRGVLNQPGYFDEGDTQIIDELPLDYSILDEIDHVYEMSNAFYGYMSRGCIRHCPFCAVPTLEPKYIPFISMVERVNKVRELYGDQKDLLLMDNNVLASKNLEQIIEEIIECGFGAGAKFTQPNLLDIAIRNLKNGINDRAYLRKSQKLIKDFYINRLHGDESREVFSIINKYHIKDLETTKKENIIAAYSEIKPYYEKHFKPQSKARYVDFNQGVDARLFTPEKAKLLAKIAIRPLRIAFDDIKTLPWYEKAIRWSKEAGLSNFSNYLLYNFKDKPEDLYERLRINVEFCESLDVNIYSFPMKYHPLRKTGDGEDFSHNRNYIGEHWNRKYIRAVQAILNSTKGKIGKGKSFFYEAFGRDLNEYMELLEMPETFILYRFFFKWLDSKNLQGTEHWRNSWKKCMNKLDDAEKERLLKVIHNNIFTNEIIEQFQDQDEIELLKYYTNFRQDIITPGTVLYKLKSEFDSLNKNA